ncbi:MAG: type III secretion system inner membrane ring subunit SctD [Chlamydiia bacterium]|nr:type III secretion system inner membrane ring subunit SctD [Chlamydiia bacterium]
MAAELFGEEGTLKGLVLTLEKGTEWALGRDPDLCSLVLEDPKASRIHARIAQTDEGYRIENLSESNPILINDHSIFEPTFLQEGDKISIGGTLFHFYPQGSPLLPSKIKSVSEDEGPYGTIYREEEEITPEIQIDLGPENRYVLKVIAGPNSGAEFALIEGSSYVLGTDTVVCDIVFHDLSVSREHAKLELTSEGVPYIEDLKSRNGVLIERERITSKTRLDPGQVVILGTSAFLVVDREAPTKTIVAPTFELPEEKKREEVPSPSKEEELLEEVEKEVLEEVKKTESPVKPTLPPGALVLTVILGLIAVLIGIGMVSLFEGGKEAVLQIKDKPLEIQNALKQFPGVKYTFNKSTGRLFLVGHVGTGVDKNELLYNLRGLTFITGIDDNVVVDESIWQEMNILLSKNPQWQGVSMHSPDPGEFALTGYLKTSKEAASLTDYMNLNFQFRDRLQNLVVVEQEVMEEAELKLMQEGLGGVTSSFSNGELTLTGYIKSNDADKYNIVLTKLRGILGVRSLRSFVVVLSPEAAVVNLNEKYPDRYQVTGFARHGNVNINVVINGKLLMRGDTIDGMTITSIQPHTIYLEKDGLKYKIEYNK